MGCFPSKQNLKIDPEAVNNFRQLFGDRSRLYQELDEKQLIDKILDAEHLTINDIDPKDLQLSEVKICYFQQPEKTQFIIKGYFTQSKYLMKLIIRKDAFCGHRNRKGWWLVIKEEIWARNCPELSCLICLDGLGGYLCNMEYLEEEIWYVPTKETIEPWNN